MRKTINFFVAFTGLLLTYVPVFAQSINKNLDQYYKALNADHEMNGNVLAAQNDQILYSKSFGFSDVAANKQNDQNSQFELASVSKLFTATAVLQLKDKGLIGLDVPFQHYFPDFPYADITVRHLLAHTSGLPDIEGLVDSLFAKHPDTVWSIHSDLAALALYSRGHALAFKPGDKWSYSSLGYHMLALLVEKVSGQTLAVYTQEHIFKPSGMTHSYIQTSFAQKNEPHRTKNYMYNNHYEMKLQLVDTLNDWKEWTHNLGLITGGGGIISTTLDLLHFDSALRSGKLLKPQTLEEAYTPYRLNNSQPSQPFDITYCGLGWFIFKDTSHGRVVWGSGANPGTISFYASNMYKKQCFVVLHNVKCNPLHDLDALEILNGKPLVYHASLAFLYAHDLYTKKREQADERVLKLLEDTAIYAMKESELDRVSLEFRRAGLKTLATETCEMHIRIFPQSADAFKDYAQTLSEYGQKDKAIEAYKKVLELNPNDAESKENVKKLSGEQ
jgi:CubicO group peptidase (beta-lactamase class C family)